MDKALEAIKNAMDKAVGDGRDDPEARRLADMYVEAYPEKFTQMRNLSVHELVQSVEVFRNANMADSWWAVEAWLLHHFEPLSVGGAFQPTVRIPTEGK